MTNNYRVLTYSNNLFIVQTKWFFLWLTEDEQFGSLAEAKAYIDNLKLLAMKPKLVDISYFE